MLTLSYTAEKDNNIVTVSNRLMVSEYQINNLLDTLVAHGYDILSTEIGDGDYSQHWNGQKGYKMWNGDLLTIHFDNYGFTLDSEFAYVSLSWATLAVLVLSVVGAKIYKSRKDR